MAAQQIADLYGSVGFRLDQKSWATLDRFEKRLDGIHKKLNMGLTGRVTGTGSGGGSGTGGGGGGSGRGRTGLSLAGSALSNVHTIGLAITGGVATTAGKAIVETTAKYDALRSSLLASTGDAESAAKEFEFLTATTKRLGLVTTEIARPFVNFSVSAKATGVSGAGVRDIFVQMSEAARGLNLTADDTAGVFRALSQMFSKGTVQSEELKGQLGERLPGAFAIAAKVMKLTTQELGDQLKAGKILAKDLIPKLAKEYQRLVKDTGAFAKATKSTSFVLGRLSEEWNKLLDRLGQSEAGDAIVNLLVEATKFFEGMGEKGGALTKTIALIALSFEAVGAAIGIVYKGWTILASAIDPLILAGIGAALLAMFSPLSAAVVAFIAISAAVEDIHAFVSGKKSLIGEYLGVDDVNTIKGDLEAIFDIVNSIGSTFDDLSTKGFKDTFKGLMSSLQEHAFESERRRVSPLFQNIESFSGSKSKTPAPTVIQVEKVEVTANDSDIEGLMQGFEEATLATAAANTPRID